MRSAAPDDGAEAEGEQDRDGGDQQVGDEELKTA
jgi:hypothetical protein